MHHGRLRRVDPDWRYSYVNKRAGEMFGRTPEELIGKYIWDEFPDGADQPFAKAYREAMAEQTTIFLEDYYEPWDRWFENRIYGSRTGIAIYFTDITERKRVEEAEQRQRERAEALRTANDDAHAHARSRGGARRAARLDDAVRPVHERERAV